MTSKDSFARSVVPVAEVVRRAGFDSVHRDAVDALVEIMGHYITETGKRVKDAQEHSQRTQPHMQDITLAMDELGVDAEDLEVYALSQPPFKWTRGQFPNFPVQPPTLKGAKAALAQATSANPFGIVPRMKDLLEAVETASTSVPTIAATSTAASGVTAAPSITPSPSSATSGAPSAPKSTPPRLKLSFGGRSLLSVPLSSTSSSAAGAATSLIMPSSALGVEDPLVDEARLAAARLRTKNDLKRRIDEGGSSKRSRTTERLLSVQQ